MEWFFLSSFLLGLHPFTLISDPNLIFFVMIVFHNETISRIQVDPFMAHCLFQSYFCQLYHNIVFVIYLLPFILALSVIAFPCVSP